MTKQTLLSFMLLLLAATPLTTYSKPSNPLEDYIDNMVKTDKDSWI